MIRLVQVFIAISPILLSATNLSIADEPAIATAIANESRTDEHHERDARSKPAEILAMFDLQTGDDVIDLMGGGGYYSELMVGVVGDEGSVILHNNMPYARFVEKQLKERYGNNQFPGITVIKSEVDDLGLAENSLDAALMVMCYHDLYYHNPERGWQNTDVGLFFSQVRGALKPGGKLLVIDHAAAAGTGKESAQTVHRIDEEFARKDIASYGFELVASSDALHNPDDDYSKMVFDKTVRGKTDRFALLFRKD
ncbi:MAG: hypothetical protein CL799_11400 [Chromatiales bacterium]|jgi:predicted methyltransferase|nr:hypothetical protein [Chromatiales bacterium]MDP7094262.1 methyltransferase domain-containing protein [Gammaproteobacteria bacterium]MDP7270589.1 methyltransferase domain-containing protein [Gammaproteobacteria bacterium]HJP04308.1 methyltransferase domain-containing protein [Gammaproteobacteria bacterium]